MGIETSAAELARPAWPTTPAPRLRAVAEAAEPSTSAGWASAAILNSHDPDEPSFTIQAFLCLPIIDFFV
jgi:hypothetical protein